MQPFIDALQAAGADVVLNGHEHNYERFAPKSGIREFVVGTGGAGLYDFGTPEAGSEVRIKKWGVILMDLSSDGYTWKFYDTADNVLDSGSSSC
jgi:hypothetical protein